MSNLKEKNAFFNKNWNKLNYLESQVYKFIEEGSYFLY